MMVFSSEKKKKKPLKWQFKGTLKMFKVTEPM